MKRSFLTLLGLGALLTTGCGKLFAEVTGNVDGHKLGSGVAYWGGPVLLFTDSDMPCDQLSWVSYRKSGAGYEDGEDLGTDENFTALQFTYESAALQDGKLSIVKTPPSPAFAYFMVSDGGVIDMYKASSGSIEIETDKKDQVSGTFELGFDDDGTLTGEFMVEKCVNLKDRHN